MAEPLLVFIAHTAELADYPEGTSFVAAAQSAVHATKHLVNEMSGFGARSERPAKVCEKEVLASDVLVLIAGFRYGSPVRDRPELSYTQLEYETACRKGIPTLVFLLGEDITGLPRSALVDHEFEHRQKEFRNQLLEEVTPKTVTTPEELKLGVILALHDLDKKVGHPGRGQDQDQWFDAEQRIARRRAAEIKDHVRPRAQGVDAGGRDMWLFTGRQAALDEACRWIAADGPSTLVVTGNPGSGKSSVLARLYVLANRDLRLAVPSDGESSRPLVHPGSIARFIHARGLAAEDVVAGLCEATDIDVTSSLGEFVAKLEGQTGDPVVVVIDAVDEAASDRTAPDAEPSRPLDAMLKYLIRRLDRTRLRLMIGTRRDRLVPLGDLADRADRATVVDLDLPDYADTVGLRGYVEKVLRYTSGSPYQQAESGRVRAVCDAVTATAGGSFLVAWITAAGLTLGSEVVDPTDPRWLAGLQRDASSAMRADLGNRLGDKAQRACELLLPLSYAKGPGLPGPGIWPVLVEALSGRRCGEDDLDWLRQNAGAYLTETTAEDGQTPVFRLFHESLAQHLRSDRDETADEDAITKELVRKHGKGGWAGAPFYVRAHLAGHAAAGTGLEGLLGDADFLIHADPAGLAPRLSRAVTDEGLLTGAVYLASLNMHRDARPAERRRLLAIDAARYGASELVDRLAKAGSGRDRFEWWPRWATGSRVHAGQRHMLSRYPERIRVVACGESDGVPRAAMAYQDGVVRLWNMLSGQAIGERWSVPGGPVVAVACADVAGVPLVVTGSADRMVRVWDPVAGPSVSLQFEHTSPARMVTCLDRDGYPVVVVVGEDGSVAVRDLDKGYLCREPLPPFEAGEAAATYVRLDGRWALVQVGKGIAVRDLFSGEPLDGGPTDAGHSGGATSVACAWLDGAPVVVTGGADGVVRVRDLVTREPICFAQNPEAGLSPVFACSAVDDTPVLLVGDEHFRLQTYDLRSGRLIGTPLAGHTQKITAVACATVDERPAAITGCYDGTGRIWDLSVSVVGHDHRAGHARRINAVTCLSVDGRQLAVTAGEDRTARVWDVANGEQVLVTDHLNSINGVAAATIGTTSVVVTGSTDRSARITDVTTGDRLGRIGEPASSGRATAAEQINAVACGVLNGAPVAVTGRQDGAVHVVDLTTGQRRRAPLKGLGSVVAVTVSDLDGSGPVAILGCADGVVHRSDLDSSRFTSVAAPGPRHPTEHLNALTLATLGGISYMIGGGCDGQVFGMSFAEGKPRLRSAPTQQWSRRIRAIAVTEVAGRVIAVTGAKDGVVRLWELDGATRSVRRLADLPTGTTKQIFAVACLEVEGRAVAVSGGEDGVVRIWDLASRTAVGVLGAVGTGRIRAITCTIVDDRPIAVVGRDRGEVHIWDLLDHVRRGVLVTGADDDVVRAVALAEVDGRTVVVAGADDGRVHRWDLDGDYVRPPSSQRWTASVTGQVDGEFLDRITAVACTQVDGRGIAALGGDKGQGLIWRLEENVRDTLALGDVGRITAVAFGRVDGRPMAAFGGFDGMLRIWDVDGARLACRPFVAEGSSVMAAACTTVQGRPAALTAGTSGAIHVWDLASGEPVGRPLEGHTGAVHAIACGTVHHDPVVVTGDHHGTIRIWGLHPVTERDHIRLPAAVFALAVTDDGAIVACIDRDVVVLELREDGRTDGSGGHPTAKLSTV